MFQSDIGCVQSYEVFSFFPPAWVGATKKLSTLDSGHRSVVMFTRLLCGHMSAQASYRSCPTLKFRGFFVFLSMY